MLPVRQLPPRAPLMFMKVQPAVTTKTTFDQITSNYTILKYEKISFGAVELRVLRLQHKTDGLVYHSLHKVENQKKTVKAHTGSFSASAGVFANVLVDSSLLREGAIQ